MPVHHDEDFLPAAAILLAGMLAPALLAAVARDFLSMYVTGRQFVLGFAVGYGIVAWGLLDRLELDRTTFLLVSIAGPWPVLIAGLFGVLLLNQGAQVPTGAVADVFRFLTGRSVGSFFGYGVVFMFAGIGAVALSTRYDALEARRERLPDGSAVVTAIVAVGVLVAGLGVGVNHATASTATIAAVEPGDDDGRPTLAVTVDGPPAELRVTATPPDGTAATKRLSSAEMGGGAGTVDFSVGLSRAAEIPLRAGTYQVTVTTLAGATVDRAEYRVEPAPEATIATVVVGPGPIDRDELPEMTIDLRPTAATRLGVAVANPAEFHTTARITIRARDAYVDSFHLRVPPGERAGVVFSIPDDAARTIRAEHDGIVTVEVSQDGRTVATRAVELPQG